MSPTLYQTDLRITNYRRQKSPPSLTLLSFKTRIKWPLGWPQPQVFHGYIFNSCNLQGNVQVYSCFYIKQIDSMLPCVCSVINHRWRQNVVRASVIYSAIASCATFLFLPHFHVICDLLLNRRTATWKLFVK